MSDRQPRYWNPLGATMIYGRPEPGRLIAHHHAVWRVLEVNDLEWSDHDRDRWLAARMPDPWLQAPYQLVIEYVAGARPQWAPPQGPVDVAEVRRRPAERFDNGWYVLPESGRWPQCSCCGEPMPCRAELQDRQINHGMRLVDKWHSRQPGQCWACGEELTRRHKTIAYEGENLDFPGAHPPRFHLRRSCSYSAEQYELRWLAVDPRRERKLTWPQCTGLLVVHGDGSSECLGIRGPLGDVKVSAPDCMGHLTHDHRSMSACYAAGNWHAREFQPCSRGCAIDGHPGTRCAPRPARPTQPTMAVFDV